MRDENDAAAATAAAAASFNPLVPVRGPSRQSLESGGAASVFSGKLSSIRMSESPLLRTPPPARIAPLDRTWSPGLADTPRSGAGTPVPRDIALSPVERPASAASLRSRRSERSSPVPRGRRRPQLAFQSAGALLGVRERLETPPSQRPAALTMFLNRQPAESEILAPKPRPMRTRRVERGAGHRTPPVPAGTPASSRGATPVVESRDEPAKVKIVKNTARVWRAAAPQRRAPIPRAPTSTAKAATKDRINPSAVYRPDLRLRRAHARAKEAQANAAAARKALRASQRHRMAQSSDPRKNQMAASWAAKTLFKKVFTFWRSSCTSRARMRCALQAWHGAVYGRSGVQRWPWMPPRHLFAQSAQDVTSDDPVFASWLAASRDRCFRAVFRLWQNRLQQRVAARRADVAARGTSLRRALSAWVKSHQRECFRRTQPLRRAIDMWRGALHARRIRRLYRSFSAWRHALTAARAGAELLSKYISGGGPRKIARRHMMAWRRALAVKRLRATAKRAKGWTRTTALRRGVRAFLKARATARERRRIAEAADAVRRGDLVRSTWSKWYAAFKRADWQWNALRTADELHRRNLLERVIDAWGVLLRRRERARGAEEQLWETRLFRQKSFIFSAWRASWAARARRAAEFYVAGLPRGAGRSGGRSDDRPGTLDLEPMENPATRRARVSLSPAKAPELLQRYRRPNAVNTKNRAGVPIVIFSPAGSETNAFNITTPDEHMARLLLRWTAFVRFLRAKAARDVALPWPTGVSDRDVQDMRMRRVRALATRSVRAWATQARGVILRRRVRRREIASTMSRWRVHTRRLGVAFEFRRRSVAMRAVRAWAVARLHAAIVAVVSTRRNRRVALVALRRWQKARSARVSAREVYRAGVRRRQNRARRTIFHFWREAVSVRRMARASMIRTSRAAGSLLGRYNRQLQLRALTAWVRAAASRRAATFTFRRNALARGLSAWSRARAVIVEKTRLATITRKFVLQRSAWRWRRAARNQAWRRVARARSGLSRKWKAVTEATRRRSLKRAWLSWTTASHRIENLKIRAVVVRAGTLQRKAFVAWVIATRGVRVQTLRIRSVKAHKQRLRRVAFAAWRSLYQRSFFKASPKRFLLSAKNSPSRVSPGAVSHPLLEAASRIASRAQSPVTATPQGRKIAFGRGTPLRGRVSSARRHRRKRATMSSAVPSGARSRPATAMSSAISRAPSVQLMRRRRAALVDIATAYRARLLKSWVWSWWRLMVRARRAKGVSTAQRAQFK